MPKARKSANVKKPSVGKKIGATTYVHKSALSHLGDRIKTNVEKAETRLPTGFEWSVIKINGNDAEIISFLDYEDFGSSAFPALRKSCLINLTLETIRPQKYSETNPPILHRKELLLSPEDPSRGGYLELTKLLEDMGLFTEMARMGTRRPWSEALKKAGLKIEGVKVVRAEFESVKPIEPPTPPVTRHKTAITRSTLSAPMYQLFTNGLISGAITVLDYGCGQGDDVNALLSAGYDVVGWDPHFRPDSSALRKSSITNLGFVLNVIEDIEERRSTLKRAFRLTEGCLAVSVMLYGQGDLSAARPYRDGYLTSKNTFQKYYTQSEIRDFISETLGAVPLAAGQGIFFVFKNELLEQRHLLKHQIGFRNRSDSLTSKPDRKEASVPQSSLGKADRELVDMLTATIRILGRQPDVSELPGDYSDRLKKSNLSHQHAANLAISEIGNSELEQIITARSEELCLHFAMHKFSQRLPYNSLPSELQRDLRAFFGSHKLAQGKGEELLFSIGNSQLLLDDVNTAVNLGIGHLENGRFLFRRDDLNRLSVRLRGYVALAERLAGDLSEADLIKIHLNSRKLTALYYPDFNMSFLPRLKSRIKIDFNTFDVSVVGHSSENSVRLLYMKSRFMRQSDLNFAKQLTFDNKIMKLGEFDFSNEGPNFREFASIILGTGISLPK